MKGFFSLDMLEKTVVEELLVLQETQHSGRH